MRVIYVPVGGRVEVKEISGSLESLQDCVNGYIEPLCLDVDTILLCNEEGKINGSMPNRFALDKNDNVIDLIYGDFVIVGVDGDGFTGLTQKQIDEYLPKYDDVADGWLRG